MSRFMRLPELGEMLGLDSKEAHALLLKEKDLPFVQFHPRGRVFLLREDVDRWLGSHTHRREAKNDRSEPSTI